MKRSVLTLVVALVPLFASPQELTLASDVWPPFTGGTEDADLASALVDEALGRAKVASKRRIMAWPEVLEAIRTGAVDGSAAMWRDAGREHDLVFSAPYLENRLVLVGRRGARVNVSDLSHLVGRKVALVADYAYGGEVAGSSGVLFTPGSSDQENLDRLLSGEVQYMLVDELVARFLVEHQPAEAEEHLEVGTVPVLRRTLHLAIRKEVPNVGEIIRRFEQAIQAMILDGTYNRILDLEWVCADLDDDGVAELVTSGQTIGTEPPTAGYVLPGGCATAGEHRGAVVVDGTRYAHWDDVPARYKVVPDPDLASDGRRSRIPRFRF